MQTTFMRNLSQRSAVAIFSLVVSSVVCSQTLTLDGTAGGRKFDGIGAVSGGGATSVLLKDYPEPQRSQILDLLFKPKFGASMSALYVEVPGDGNSTQGSELSHMHTKTDENYGRGYEWWLMVEAKKRNPALSLDGSAWSAPGWVGNGNYWSQDMADYYVKWLKGLKANYGLDMDAIGCRNEWGWNGQWVKTYRTTLDNAGLTTLRIHAFDAAGATKWDFAPSMNTDVAMRNAIGIISAHTIGSDIPAPATVMTMSTQWNKPIWNTEEHPYTTGFAGALETVHDFNQNYVGSGVTKVVNWYLAAAFYPVEPFFNVDPPVVAASPWTGHYSVTPKIWAYAHYGQFTAIGWTYLNGACGTLSNKGTYVTLTSGADYSVIVETQGATVAQTLNLAVKGGLSTGAVSVWRSNSTAQFVQQASITPVNGSYSISLDANSIYSITTTTGQQKGSYPNIPADAAFPFPYYETFDHYTDAKSFGYLPHYTADITAGFELVNNPTGTGLCLRQAVPTKAQSWGPEWMPYTVFGNQAWKDYEVSADVYLDNGGWAGVMGRVSATGPNGWGCNPNGYYVRLDNAGNASLWESNQDGGNGTPGTQLATGKATGVAAKQWHNVKLQFVGTAITGLVDNVQVFKTTGTRWTGGLAGLVAGGEKNVWNTADYDNVIVNTVNGAKPAPTAFVSDGNPMYGASTRIVPKPSASPATRDEIRLTRTGSGYSVACGSAGCGSLTLLGVDGRAEQLGKATSEIIPFGRFHSGVYLLRSTRETDVRETKIFLDR